MKEKIKQNDIVIEDDCGVRVGKGESWQTRKR